MQQRFVVDFGMHKQMVNNYSVVVKTHQNDCSLMFTQCSILNRDSPDVDKNWNIC